MMRTLLLSTAFMVMLATPAWADDSWASDIEVMSAEDLDAHRGGFAIGNLNINFGATVTTLVNGAPALVTTLTWTETGSVIQQTVGDIGQNIADMSVAQREALGLGGLENAGGLVIDDEDGVTALVHNVTGGALQNIIINNAMGRDISQEIDVQLELPGFEGLQAMFEVQRFAGWITDDIQQGIVFGGP
ncbi:MAG: hypothetical protein ABL889_00515 [Terricaulis sp.]